MNTLSVVQSRIALEAEEGRQDSFKIGGVTLELYVPESDDHWDSCTYKGMLRIRGNDVSVNVGETRVSVDCKRSVLAEDITKWDARKDVWPNYSQVRSVVSKMINDYVRTFDAMANYPSTKVLCGMTFELFNIDAEGIKLDTVSNKHVKIEISILYNRVDIWIKRKLVAMNLDLKRMTPDTVFAKIEQELVKRGFNGDMHAEIDVVLRDKRTETGKRQMRYRVDDYRTALQEIESVLKKHQVQAVTARVALENSMIHSMDDLPANIIGDVHEFTYGKRIEFKRGIDKQDGSHYYSSKEFGFLYMHEIDGHLDIGDDINFTKLQFPIRMDKFLHTFGDLLHKTSNVFQADGWRATARVALETQRTLHTMQDLPKTIKSTDGKMTFDFRPGIPCYQMREALPKSLSSVRIQYTGNSKELYKAFRLFVGFCQLTIDLDCTEKEFVETFSDVVNKVLYKDKDNHKFVAAN